MALQLVTGLKRPKKRLTVCADDGEWIEKEEEDEIEFLFVAQYAKSSRAKCRRCAHKIEKGN